MTQFPHDSIKPFSEEGGKKQQVSQMFDTIAGRYDFLNRFLSLGIDVSWRKKAIKKLEADKPAHLLDVATGTADMALMAAKMLQPQQITGIDISEGMLAIGREKVAKAALPTNITLQLADSETIPFEIGQFDGAMVAFGVRNFEHLDRGLAEINRVLKPGAQLVVLEFSQPVMPGFRQLYKFYMTVLAPQVAGFFRTNKKAYQYLNKSAHAFPDRERFVNIMRQAGFEQPSFQALTMGICCIYTGRKKAV
jgi:demethylmenaquinone methyltransferase / 2-methoxy-6-polyprenyl-1,4-benzoquinol methylase